MPSVKLRPAPSFEIAGRKGPLVLRVYGKPWNGMLELRDSDGRALVVGTPEIGRFALGFADMFGGVFNFGQYHQVSEWDAQVITGDRELLIELGLASEPRKTEAAKA